MPRLSGLHCRFVARCFGRAFRRAAGYPVDQARDALAVAAASKDIASVGRLLWVRYVNTVSFDEKELSESLVPHPLGCSLLEVEVGSGSVEMTKSSSSSTVRDRRVRQCETLKQSISTGNLELITLMRRRLPEAELRERVDLLEVAAE
jgi:hypothetical protein